MKNQENDYAIVLMSVLILKIKNLRGLLENMSMLVYFAVKVPQITISVINQNVSIKNQEYVQKHVFHVYKIYLKI